LEVALRGLRSNNLHRDGLITLELLLLDRGRDTHRHRDDLKDLELPLLGRWFEGLHSFNSHECLELGRLWNSLSDLHLLGT
jgi:hypothetical protein